jgi:deoxyribodipyrimidine photo-lyase
MGKDYSTKFSAWISAGALSPRWVYWRIAKFNDLQDGQSVDTYWVCFELLLR